MNFNFSQGKIRRKMYDISITGVIWVSHFSFSKFMIWYTNSSFIRFYGNTNLKNFCSKQKKFQLFIMKSKRNGAALWSARENKISSPPDKFDTFIKQLTDILLSDGRWKKLSMILQIRYQVYLAADKFYFQEDVDQRVRWVLALLKS